MNESALPHAIINCPNSKCNLTVRFPNVEGIATCPKCGIRFKYFPGESKAKSPQKPEDAPLEIKNETKALLDNVVSVCKKFLTDKRKAAEALHEISKLSLVTKDGLFRLQVTITDSQGKRLYHIQDDLIDTKIDFDLPNDEAGEFLGKPIFSVGCFERQTLFRYREFKAWKAWNWYIFIEGHWYLPHTKPTVLVLADNPNDTPGIVNSETETHFSNVLKILKKANANNFKEEIDHLGKSVSEFHLGTQVTVTDTHGMVLYHIADDMIGKIPSEPLRHNAFNNNEGWFLDSGGRGWRRSLWRYKKVPKLGLYLFVEGHWYPQKIDNIKIEDEAKYPLDRDFNELVRVCYSFLMEIEKQLSYNFQPSIIESFKQQIILALIRYPVHELSLDQKNLMGEITKELFPGRHTEIEALLNVTPIEGLANERWIKTLSDICLASTPRKTIVRYLFLKSSPDR